MLSGEAKEPQEVHVLCDQDTGSGGGAGMGVRDEGRRKEMIQIQFSVFL